MPTPNSLKSRQVAAAQRARHTRRVETFRKTGCYTV